MKLFLIITFLILFACNNTSTNILNKQNSESFHKSNENKDTIIKVFNIPYELSTSGIVEKEYYIVSNGDTSDFSCIFSFNTFKDRISMNYVFTPTRKYFDIFIEEDSSAIYEFSDQTKHTISNINYKDQLREIQLILNYYSKEFDLLKLQTIRFSISSIDSLSEKISLLYLNNVVNEVNSINIKKLISMINNSNVIYDFNRILLKHNLKIHDTDINDLFWNDNKSKLSHEKNNHTSSTLTRDKLIDGSVVFSLAPLK